MTKSQSPVTVHHPDLEDVSYEVPAAEADAWVAAGWRKTKPSAADS